MEAKIKQHWHMLQRILFPGFVEMFDRFGLNRARQTPTMKTLAVIFVLALINIAFEIYSDAALTSAEVSHTSVPDPATAAIAHALKHG